MSQNSKSSIYDGGFLPEAPAMPKTVIEALRRTAKDTANQNNIIYIQADGTEKVSTYRDLLTEAERILAGLRRHNLEPGDHVILQLNRNDDILPAFWGCLLGGFIPLIAAVPPTYAMASRALDQLMGLWHQLERPLMLTNASMAETHDLPALQQRLGLALTDTVTIEQLRDNDPDQAHHAAQPDDILFFSTTSGSTGVPKCIGLTHRNILSRALGVNTVQNNAAENVILNWLPFDHIGAISDHHLRFVALGCTLVYAPKELVISHPLTWLELLTRYRVTHSWAPNFFYKLILNALDVIDSSEATQAPAWDLAAVEVLITAGEAVSAETVTAFVARLSQYGLKSTALCPVFGMAEMGSGVTYFQPTHDRPFGFHTVRRAATDGAGYETFTPTTPDDPNRITFTSLGRPIPGVSLRLVDQNNQPISTPATVGRLQVQGAAVSAGYYRNHAASEAVFLADGWFDTEDLAFMLEGELYLTGRTKESIIINGANFYSSEIEQVATAVAGVEASYTAACAVRQAGRTTEQLAIFFHPTGFDTATDADLIALIRQIRKAVASQIGVTPAYVLPLAKTDLPKTSIGKIQRTRLSQQFESGAFDALIQRFQSRRNSPPPPQPLSTPSRKSIEQQIAKIWQSALQVDQVGLRDNFFELGGHSVLLIQIHTHLKEQFKTDLALVDLFKYPTVDALARHLSPELSPVSTPSLRQHRQPSQQDDIAVVGLACRFPGADTPEKFWQNLRDGVESITFFDDDELLAAGVNPALLQNTNYVKANPTIPDIDCFDAQLFGYTPSEAALMDPQQRIMLECAWETLESAGYNPLTYPGVIGMYAGAVWNTYQLNNLYPVRHQLDGNGEMQIITPDSLSGFQMMVANDKDYLTTRVSYKLNLTGPSINVQTACSTGLVAVHMAIQSLRLGECDMALAGGISIQVPQTIGYLYQEGMMVSPDGHCRAFDANAQGTIFGSGGGLVLLKRLADAVTDGDTIYAVIKGSAVNNDGGEKVGYFAPKGDGQAEVVAQALAAADVKAETVTYVEAHGTGTILGDPIEIGGLTQAFRATTDKSGFCAVGSVKTNIGHLQIASGIAGLIKTVLALHHKKLPPSLHFDQPNPQIDFANTPFYVNTTLQEWTTQGDLPRRAGVNSLGVGGTNVHVILEEAPPASPTQPETERRHIINFSTQSEGQLRSYAQNLRDFIEGHPDISLLDMTYTLQIGRVPMANRLAFVAADTATLSRQLTDYLAGQPHIDGCYQGQYSSGNNQLDFLAEDEDDLNALIDRWLNKGRIEKIAELWVRGVNLDWLKLYGLEKPRRISLPTYPFAKERHWISANAQISRNQAQAAPTSNLHPLLHRNTSILAEQRFNATFVGTEFFLKDHQVRGERILPGAAYIEMVRAACELALDGYPIKQLKNMVWVAPIIVKDEPLEIQVGLHPATTGAVTFEVRSITDGQPVVYCYGEVFVEDVDESERLDIDSIQARCDKTLSGADCYREFQALGLTHGSTFQGLEKVHYNAFELLAQLRNPDPATAKDYTLHPGLLDSALQAAVALSRFGDQDTRLYLPFTVEHITIYSPVPENAYAHVTYNHRPETSSDVIKYDIVVTDASGQIVLSLNGFTARAISRHAQAVVDRKKPLAVTNQAAKEPTKTAHSNKGLSQAAQNYLAGLLAEALKLPLERLEANTAWESYNIDSVQVLSLTRRLEQHFGELPKTLFFEYRTLADLAGYFTNEHLDRLQEQLTFDPSPPEQQMPSDNPMSISPVDTRRSRWGPSLGSGRSTVTEDIAIIGLSGRYPMAENLAEFWENLKQGRDCIGEIPADRWDYRLHYHPDRKKAGKITSKWGGFMADVDKFDPLFFNISPREAEILDPQERLFLEIAWQTLEDAGYTRQTLQARTQGQVGVFVGVMWGEYSLYSTHEIGISGSYASIANRVSYLLNLQGPSMAVDTMCSSSLTSIHLACESIKRGECRAALAGGVNVSLHPNKYLYLSQEQFAASDGRCRSFGAGGDGYVPGEGVGAVLLKPLSQAKADGDPIYGVIKGSSLNHGGKTNGYTVPNPTAQAQLIAEALQKSRVNPNTISYIEAHGTGTALGDPIEIRGLSQAFGEGDACAIGSVKSNIGHLESAAGIAALTKVLLQIKHRQLVPSLHSDRLNPHINFSTSRFKVQQVLAEWPQPVVEVNGTKKVFPRRASISSFGAGGSNAHLVVEEYQGLGVRGQGPGIRAQGADDGQRCLIVLSAKNEARLTVYAKRMLEFIEENVGVSLTDMAYTLQMGREAMAARLAFVAGAIEDVRATLAAYLTNKPGPIDFYQSTVKNNSAQLNLLTDGDESQAIIDLLLQRGQLAKLAQLWINGVDIDWTLLYRNTHLQRISLPTYPFAKERYWVPNNAQSTMDNSPFSILHSPFSIALLHPLVHRNTSTLTEQRFDTTLTGDEFFLADHRVQGEKVLPGVAYLEMARAAGNLAASPENIVQIKNVVWANPIVVEARPIETVIHLDPLATGEIAFQVSTLAEPELALHSQGRLALGAIEKPERLNLEAIQARCSETIAGADAYRLFEERGLTYGPAMQGLIQVSYNRHEALAWLHRPDTVGDAVFGLHPSLVDGALQAIIGLGGIDGPGLSLPFAVEQVTIYGTIPAQAYAYVTYSEETSPSENLTKYDIALVDDRGDIIVLLEGFMVRKVSGPVDAVTAAVKNEMLYSTPVWEKAPIIAGEEKVETDYDLLLVLAGLEQDSVDHITKVFTHANVIELPKPDPDLAGVVTTAVQQCLGQVKTIIKQHPKQTYHILVLAAQTEYLLYAALAGMLKSVRQEHPKIRGKLVAVADPAPGRLASILQTEIRPNTFDDAAVRYDQTGEREVKRLVEIKPNWNNQRQPYLKLGGVYWITGGLGGLGRIFARYLAQQGQDITVVLSGRSPLDEAGQKQLAELKTENATIRYLPADVSHKADVERVLQTIKTEYGPLKGIIHSAGVLRDSFIINKSEAEVATVLAPKVAGIINIDALTAEDTLDFLVLFSSLAGVIGNVGQTDYAAANAFLDAFAHYRQQQVALGERFGRTLSINWPLWRDGGMTVDTETETWLANTMGMRPLTTDEGLTVFDYLLSQDELTQLVVVAGEHEKIRQTLEMAQSPLESLESESRQSVVPQPVSQDAQRQIENDLIDISVALLKVKPTELDTETDFSDYGVDSIMMMRMLNALEEKYSVAVPPSIIIENPTIRQLAAYLIEAGIGPIVGSQNGSPAKNDNPAETPIKNRLASMLNLSRRNSRFGSGHSGKVAVIGQSCRLPQSPTPERFWQNLATEKNLITTAPSDRWPAEAFYHPQPGQPGKTYTNHGAFVDNIAYFDAEYFGISDDEAISMDPQQRVMLELAQELWDQAGYSRSDVADTNTGIFIGAKENNYVRNYFHLIPEAAMQHTIVNSISNMIAARISDYYNLKGTAQVLDTACSSSLVAVHDACQAILRHETDMAIAGGIFLMVDAFSHIGFSQAQVLSDDGISYVFDERAKGFVLGEGGGLILLKNYEAALQDGDQILGVILGSAVNNDGHTMGLTVPNQAGQKAVIETALQRSNISPADIGYLEAHGTGTLLGDPIEIKAAAEVYRQYTDEKQFCAVGSVKSNVGHTMTAAGVVGLHKLLLALEHRQIPATLHCERPHPRFQFEESPFYPNTRLRDWQPRNGRHIGAISSFGFGGTNCHLIVETGPTTQSARRSLPPTQFTRKRYWLGQEISPEAANSFDEAYYRALVQQLQRRDLSRSAFEALVMRPQQER